MRSIKNIRNMLVAVIAITSISFSSHAFEGFSIGVLGSDADFNTTGSEIESGTTSSTSEKTDATKKSNVNYGAAFAEYTFSQGSTIGLEYIPGAATLGSTTRTDTATNTGDGAGDRVAKAEVSDHITIYAEPTFMMSDNFGVYVKGGASRVSVNSQESNLPSSTYGNVDVWGVTYGVGAKLYHNNWFVKLERMETEYGDIVLHSSDTTTNHVITAKIDSTATKMAVGYNF